MNKQNTLLHLKELGDLSNLNRTSNIIKNIRDVLGETLDYNYDISQYDDEKFTRKNIEEHLGQVKTPSWIAKLISNLCIKQVDQKILDPCFGAGVFLDSAYDQITSMKHTKKPNLWGVEIDLIRFAEGLQNFSKNKKNIDKSFFCGNIFDFEENSFDCILMNPPYTRQEKLPYANHHFIEKEVIHKKIKELCGINLSLRSNLYVYFIVYLSSLLKNGGRMGIIIPKGWMDSKHGIEFQKFLLKNFEIEFIIDFSKDTFDDVIVEDCVLILKKVHESSSRVCFVRLNDKTNENIFEKILKKNKSFKTKKLFVSYVERNILLEDHKWGKFLQMSSNTKKLLQEKNLVPLSEFAEVSRGIGTNWNDFFILDEKTINQFDIPNNFLTKIISSPKKVNKLDTTNEVNFDYLLTIHTPLDSFNDFTGIQKYIDVNYKKILEKSNNSVLKKQALLNSDSWYVTKSFKPSPIIFSYIIRKSKFFIKNSKKYLVRDNFYNILPKEIDVEVLFALLNSSLISLQLEMIGRRYGNGVLKIQVYELQDLKLPNIRIMPKKVQQKLIEESKKLSKFRIHDDEKSKIIDKIDLIIENFCKLQISSKEIKQMEKQMLKTRVLRGR